MTKFIISLLIVSLFCGCSFPARKDINHLLNTKIEQIEIEVEDIPELIIVERLNYYLTPLILGIFSGVLLIALNLRVIGLSILLASTTCIVLIVTLAAYFKLIAIIGIVVLLAGIYFLGRKIYFKNKMEKELVKSVEESKKYISKEDKELLKEKLDKGQSEYTKANVKVIKDKLGEKK